MYVKHPKLVLNYPDSKKIWRYMYFKRFADLIKTKSLFFCRADKFEDKWEGHFPKEMIQKFKLDKTKFPSSDGNSYTACQWQIHKEARSHLISCWHANESESFAMWKIYSKCNEPAIVIQSTIARLKRSFHANDERIWFGEVEYIDFTKWEPDNRFFNVGTPNILKAFFLKWNYFEYEHEIRAVINKSYNEHKFDVGIHVKIDLIDLIEGVRLSPISDQKNEKQIKELLEKHNCSFSIEKSDLGMNLYM